MASLLIIFLILVALVPFAVSQNPKNPSPTMADCASSLIPLSPCASYVQGMIRSPAQMCCDNLKRVYSQQSGCLCLLLNTTTSNSNIPINRTLALQLPVLCDLQADISACSGVAGSPSSQVSLGSNNNATVAASPMVVPVAAGPMRLPLDKSAGLKSNTDGILGIMATVITVFFYVVY